MLRLYRKIQPDEFFVVFGDTAQGGEDKNFVQFMSKDKADIPLVLSMNGVCAEMTPHLRTALEWIFDQTKVRPIVALERQNGGASGMYDLMQSNKLGKYDIYYARDEKGRITDKPGWDTNTVTRPRMIGDWKTAYESKLIGLYDAETLAHHKTFITNARGKPEAAANAHDDAVMSCAGAYQMYQTEHKPIDARDEIYEDTSGDSSSLIY